MRHIVFGFTIQAVRLAWELKACLVMPKLQTFLWMLDDSLEYKQKLFLMSMNGQLACTSAQSFQWNLEQDCFEIHFAHHEMYLNYSFLYIFEPELIHNSNIRRNNLQYHIFDLFTLKPGLPEDIIEFPKQQYKKLYINGERAALEMILPKLDENYNEINSRFFIKHVLKKQDVANDKRVTFPIYLDDLSLIETPKDNIILCS